MFNHVHRRFVVPGLAASLSALLAISGCAAPERELSISDAIFSGPDTVSMKIDGMACHNCARHIAHELEEVPGVRAAAVDFDSSTAKVALDPANPASMDSLNAAVAQWRTEHFSAEEDPECLDPRRREEIKKGS